MEMVSSRHIRSMETSIKSPEQWLNDELASMTTIQFKVANTVSRIISGYVSTKKIDRGGDVTLPTVFEDSMPRFMRNPVICWMHKWDQPVGKILDYKIDSIGLFVKGQIAKGIKWIDEKLWPEIKAGIVKGLSYGYKTLESEPAEYEGKMITLLKKVQGMVQGYVMIMNESSKNGWIVLC